MGRERTQRLTDVQINVASGADVGRPSSTGSSIKKPA